MSAPGRLLVARATRAALSAGTPLAVRLGGRRFLVRVGAGVLGVDLDGLRYR